MSSLYIKHTCQEALRTLQDHKEAEMVFYIYITEDDNSLVGIASLRALATTNPEMKLKEIMVKTCTRLGLKPIKKRCPDSCQYNYLAVPVVDTIIFFLES